MSRKFVIIYENEKYLQNVSNNIAVLETSYPLSDITLYVKKDGMQLNVQNQQMPHNIRVIPSEFDTQPKIRNWINSQNKDFDGFVHVLSDQLEIVKDPSDFVADLENTMSALDYHVWFSTVTDGCNFIYSKYNPRMRISCDRPECAALNMPAEIEFTSHSNTQWVSYNMKELHGSDLLRFDERFTVPMFYIIEFLARRRNTKPNGSLFFMNQYLSVASECGTIRNYSGMTSDTLSREVMQREDFEFKKMNVNFSPDNNIDKILEIFWEKILKKNGII